MTVALLAALGCVGGVAAYSWWEAGWLRREVLEVSVTGLPRGLDGIRVGHLSDFHLGSRLSRGDSATARAVAWLVDRNPDLVCITGDLLARRRGESALVDHLQRLGKAFLVLGNHDVRDTRDPFSRGDPLPALPKDIHLLRNARETVAVRGVALHVIGLDPLSPAPDGTDPQLFTRREGLTIALVHDPADAARLPDGSADVILAGHLHGGQISLPWAGRAISIAHPRAPRLRGIHATPTGVLHISSGTGTSFVPFRLFARPSVTELVLRLPS